MGDVPAGVAGIDADRLATWIGEHVEVEPPLRLTAVGHGRSNLTYRIDDAAGRTWVLRRPPLGPLLPSAHDVVREHRIIARLATAGVAVPQPVAVCEDGAVLGAPFYLMEHVDGLVLHRTDLAESLTRSARRASMLSLVEALAAVQAVDVDEVGLGDLGRRENYAERQLRRWGKQWEASKLREVPAIDRVGALLAERVPPQQGVVLVHGDFRLDNAIVGRDGSVRAILDWELSTLGDPLADLGTWLAFTPREQSEAIAIHDPVTLLPGFPSHEELIDDYVARTGRDVGALPFWYALSLWKLAIILQGVYRRWREDPRNGGEGAGELEPLVATLALRAEAAVTGMSGGRWSSSPAS